MYNVQSSEPVSQQLIERMTSQISHRGPDDRGAYFDGNPRLGFARLSIIDLSGGHQSMSNGTGEVWVVFYGEIWNYQELRKQLLEKGHQFRTNSDTETIVHAYEEYGVDCVARLHGMFGFAIWHASRKRLLLARDRAGKKPLFYSSVNGDLLFASEIKSLLCHPQVKRQADPQALADNLSVRNVPGPATLIAHIYKVLPGHWVLCENGKLREECYWDYRFVPTEHRPVEEYIQGIRQHVHRSVEERMLADVPVGALLSGGIYSSIVTGTMSQLTHQPMKTFAVVFDVPGFSELPYTRLVAEHYELALKGSNLPAYWPLLTWHHDEPVSESSDLGVYLVSKLARKYMKEVLSGEGRDELFAGYPKYVFDGIARYYHLLPVSIRNQVITPLLDRLSYSMRKLKTAAHTLSQPAPQRWMGWFGVFNGSLKEHILSESTRATVDLVSSRVFRRWLEKNPQRDDLSSMLYLDTKIWLPDNLLMKGDKMTMAASLETRMPLLDYKLTEYAAIIPHNMKIKPFKAKYLFKRAFADFLPEPILTRKKMGFNVPIGTWFREDQRNLITQLLLSERIRSRGYLNDAFVATMLRDHLEGRTNFQAQLFILVSLELWFRLFIDDLDLVCPRMAVVDLLDDNEIGSQFLAPQI